MKLHIGHDPKLAREVTLPLEALVQTFAILAIRGAGKTTTATVMAEEFCKAGLPWICLDPVGTWWGIRASADGRHPGFPVIVIGGQHADIPIERTSGAAIAKALLADKVSAVIDLSQESKRFWHTFVTDFALTLMESNPESPRHIFVEEAPEFLPQRTRVDLTARCREAVERLIRLGRNRGYGCTIISQRPATVSKDSLSQCENLLVLRTTGPHDRKALTEWIEAKAPEKKISTFLDGLASLPNGTAWFWSPFWLKTFERITIRPRESYHPGATRTVGKVAAVPTLMSIEDQIEKVRSRMRLAGAGLLPQRAGRSDRMATAKALRNAWERGESTEDMVTEKVIRDATEHIRAEAGELILERDALKAKVAETERRLAAVRKAVEPMYLMLKQAFEESAPGQGAADRTAYEPWLAKANRAGIKRMFEVLLDRRELTQTQWATLAGLGPTTGTFSNYRSWFKRNGLIELDGKQVRLKPL